MPEVDLGPLAFVWRGPYQTTTTYEKNHVVFSGGNSYIYKNDTPEAGKDPTDTVYWDIMARGSGASNFHNRIYKHEDTARKSFGSTFANGLETPDYLFRASALALVHIYVPVTNQSTSYGGLVVKVLYSVNSAAYIDYGHTGTATIIDHGASQTGFFTGSTLIDPQQTADFNMKILLQYRSYDGDAWINGQSSSSIEMGANWSSKVIIEEKQA